MLCLFQGPGRGFTDIWLEIFAGLSSATMSKRKCRKVNQQEKKRTQDHENLSCTVEQRTFISVFHEV